MSKKVFSVFFIIMISVCIFSLTVPNTVLANKSISDIITSADDFISMGETQKNSGISDNSIKNMSNIIYNILLIIGIAVAVIVGLVIGIKFMTGSASEKAKVKETLVPYIAGCVVLFGAFTIWKIVVTILQSNI